MNEAVKQLSLFIRDLLNIPESQIKPGRLGFVRDDFKALQIVPDSLGAAERLNSAESFDGELEKTTYAQQYRSPCTINFYGDGAYGQAVQFSLLAQSQKGYELQRDRGVTIYEVGTLTDVKALTGEQYSERYELALNVQITLSAEVDTLRIDTLQSTLPVDN